MIAVAKREVGVLERTGHNDHPHILMYHKSVSEYLYKMRPVAAYCASFVNYAYKIAGVKVTKVPNPARARDWFLVPERLVISQQSLKGNRRMMKQPKGGDVIGYYFAKHSNRISHIEIFLFFDSKDENYFWAIGANTSGRNSAISVDRAGEGVFLVKRNIKSFHKIFNIIDP